MHYITTHEKEEIFVDHGNVGLKTEKRVRLSLEVRTEYIKRIQLWEQISIKKPNCITIPADVLDFLVDSTRIDAEMLQLGVFLSLFDYYIIL